ncbi:MAG: hypothetical protein R3F14_29090 [Polyangiaceae bacterium]
MTVDLETLRAFVRQCDPAVPLQGTDPRYVDLSDVRGEGEVSCVELLERNVKLLDSSCQLFTGYPGTGKTTELRRLQKRLDDITDLPTHVVYIAFEEYIDIYSPISIADVLRVLAYELERAATAAEGKDPDKDNRYVERLKDFFKNADLDLKKLEFGTSGSGANLMLEIRSSPSFRQKVEAALQGRFQRFASDAHAAMEDAVSRLQKARGAHAQRVVVIADGLEKLNPLRDEDREKMEASVEAVFLTHAGWLRLPCHGVYTFPLWLRYRRADLGANYHGEPMVLPMVKVTKPDGSPWEPGLAKLRTLISARLDETAVFGPTPDETLRPLLQASGGYLRDLLRMVRSVLTTRKTLPMDAEGAERIIRRLAEDYSRTVLGTDLDALVSIATDHRLPKDDPAQLAAFGRLIERYLVLAYRNGEEWYDVHPMTRRDPMLAARLANRTTPSA